MSRDWMGSDFPTSIEEAAALLGAAITRWCAQDLYSYTTTTAPGTVAATSPLASTSSSTSLSMTLVHVPPPAGMHRAFGAIQPAPTTELLQRLHDLRALLRSAPRNEPLPAAPSILAALMKLMGLSKQLAINNVNSSSSSGSAASVTGSAMSPPPPLPSSMVSTVTSSSGGSAADLASSTAAATPRMARSCWSETPPLWSTPIRTLWVDCVVQCHLLSQGLTGTAKIDSTQFLRQMTVDAAIHPRSARAAGGVRLAAFHVLQGLLYQPALATQLAPWSGDVMIVCHKALKSAGNGEPSYRVAAVQAACAAATACRNAALHSRGYNNNNNQDHQHQTGNEINDQGSDPSSAEAAASVVVLLHALEDKAIQEAVRVVKQAATDKFPDVRAAAATLASQLAPLMILTASSSGSSSSSFVSGGTERLACMEECLVQVVLRNLDDEMPIVAELWAQAAAHILTTALSYNVQSRLAGQSQAQQPHNRAMMMMMTTTTGGDGAGGSMSGGLSSVADDVASTSLGGGGGTDADVTSMRLGSGTAGRKPLSGSWTMQHCSSLKRIVFVLVDHFVRAGGEYIAARLGGTFSSGGRAVRMGWSAVLVHLLRLQTACLQNVGEGRSMSVRECMILILEMTGDEMERQLLRFRPHKSGDLALSSSSSSTTLSTSAASAVSVNPLFGSSTSAARTWSRADPALVKSAVHRVLRQGISQVATEAMQLTILQDLIHVLPEPTIGSSVSTESTAPVPSGGGAKRKALNPSQLQVVLIEISHLLATLGEAAASKVDDLVQRLSPGCIQHADHGVRHEAALACTALASSFPDRGGRWLLHHAMQQIQEAHAQLITAMSMQHSSQKIRRTKGGVVASSGGAGSAATSGEDDEYSGTTGSGGLRMFRRAMAAAAPSAVATDKPPPTAPPDFFLAPQNAMHGLGLVVSLLIRDLPRLPGGLPRSLLATAVSVAEILVRFQIQDTMTEANPGAVCYGVRAGFGIFAGVVSTGPGAMEPYMPLIVKAWQTSCQCAHDGSTNMAARHDLFCLDSVVLSIAAFLKYCSELLLSVPEALNQVTRLLEDMLPLVSPQGRLGSIPPSLPVTARLESTRASLLEAFAWLPSGSFPMVADDVFAFAGSQIRSAVENDVTCSILNSLVSREDSLLDAKAFTAARREGQVGGAMEYEEILLNLRGEVALHGEREAVLYVRDNPPWSALQQSVQQEKLPTRFQDSCILHHFAGNEIRPPKKPPTPLHEVGTWRMPLDPSCSAKVRLVDAAIQAFSATFGLKSGKEQQTAMDMLESLVPPLLTQLARTLGVNTSLTEADRRGKAREDSAAAANITAVLLSCLQALPLHEATHNVPIGLGPSWMNTAKDLLLTVLPSASTIVRRGAAEGLALLATLGVSEDAHFLQSAVLHSLDEVMKGHKPDGKPRTIALEPVSAARAGALLTLACIQRTSRNVALRQLARTRGRVEGSKVEQSSDGDLPVLQMMTRLIPSLSCYGLRDYFVVRTYALHSFAVLQAYSSRLDATKLTDEGKQLLRKCVELVEENFSSAWTAASLDVDRGQELEKMASEVAFLSVILRIMTFLVPHLHHIQVENPDVARRCCTMATLIRDAHGTHPTVAIEALAFYEVLAAHQDLLPSPSKRVAYTEIPILSCIPFVLNTITPDRPVIFPTGLWERKSFWAPGCVRAAVHVARVVTSHEVPVNEWSTTALLALLVTSFEYIAGARCFVANACTFRSLATNLEMEEVSRNVVALEVDIFNFLNDLLCLQRSLHPTDEGRYFRWILCTRAMLASSSSREGEAPEGDGYSRARVMWEANQQASLDVALLWKNSTGAIRWQTKTLAVQLGSRALVHLMDICRKSGAGDEKSPHFQHSLAVQLCAKSCKDAVNAGAGPPPSLLVFHLEEILATTSMNCVATLDHSELCTLQESAMHGLLLLIEGFAKTPDPEVPDTNILDQYATQTFSTIKHAIGVHEEVASKSANGLFVAGCEALGLIVEKGLAVDVVVLKRLIRPAVPTCEETPFFSYSDGPSPSPLWQLEETHVDTRSALLLQVGKIWIAGKLLLGNTLTPLPQYLENVSSELVPSKVNLAVHSAAVAIDGARLLHGHGLSLAGFLSEIGSTRCADYGMLYENLLDIDDAVKALFAKTWSSCASCAVKPLLLAIEDDDLDEEMRQSCREWIGVLLPLFIAGIYDGLGIPHEPASPVVDWAANIKSSSVLVDCLRGFTMLVDAAASCLTEEAFLKELEKLLSMIRTSILVPSLDHVSEKSASGKGADATPKHDDEVVIESCLLLRSISKGPLPSLRKDPALLVCLLSPLELLQSGKIFFDSPMIEEVISSCLAGVASLIFFGDCSDGLVKASLILAIRHVLAVDNILPERIKDSGKALLKQCLGHGGVSLKYQCEIASDLASRGNWEAWSVFATVKDGLLVSNSLSSSVQLVFRDPNQAAGQVAVLVAIKTTLQTSGVPSTYAGRVMNCVGCDVISALYHFGTTFQIPPEYHSFRVTACADAIKILLMGHQQIVADDRSMEQGMVAAFLSLLFETLLSILRCNGLPNHPAPPTAVHGAESGLGRMAAQTILHVARSTPVAFKASLATMADHDRTLLEYAVRAEMTGYVVQASEPSKKKLNIKSFQR